MIKPTISNMPSEQDIIDLENSGYVFEVYDDKKIVAKAKVDKWGWFCLEDGTELIRNPEGEFSEWPEDSNV